MKKLTVNTLFAFAAIPLAINQAYAGAGWGDSLDISGLPIKMQTYYANSPSGMRPDPLGGPAINTGAALRKFVDTLPGLTAAGANNLGQYIPLATPVKWVNMNGVATNDDYYEIALIEYTEKMHSDLAKATRLRGYVQLSTPTNPGKHLALTYPNGTPIRDAKGVQVYAVDNPHYLGPLIVAKRGVAIRVKFSNYLPVGAAGNLFIPVDHTLPGAGIGPDGVTMYPENRALIHWHGGDTPWVSDGTPHQWVAPAGESAAMAKGASNVNVPDMPDPGPGSTTYYWPNNMSGRMMFYHDHSLGLTRLNVYAGEVAGYLLQDPVEQGLVTRGVIPGAQIPLIIQDKTFVPKDIAQQDAKWDPTHWGQEGDLWFPHVYETNQDPSSFDGTNPVGRWDWGPWFWPVFPAQYSLPSGNYGDASTTPEAFMDTPVINGTAYPSLTVDPKAYRFRILNASNDRFISLSLYQADPSLLATDPGYGKEVKMVPASADPTGASIYAAIYPHAALWPADGRAGGVPDPAMVGPDIIQIGNEGGLLPQVAVIPTQPVVFEQNRRSITVLNILNHGLYMGPAERADVVIDFSKYAGKTLILYNDSPAPVPAFDPRVDYFTGNGDQTGAGGAGNTLAGYGPNTRTMMQIKVRAATPVPFDLVALQAALPAAYAASQPAPIVPGSVYNAAFGTSNADNYARIASGSITQPNMNWTPAGIQTITGVTLVDGGTGYKTAPTVTFSGGGATTPATATATISPITHKVAGITLTSPGTGYTSAPLISFAGGGGIGATASVTTSLTQSLPVQNKAIQELFEPIYGRMNATLGVELPFTSALIQTTIPLGYVDPATETIADGETQIWKITHNGVDTHPVHFHLVNVQLLNRIGWDGTVKPPADNEVGWKETVKMNPLEDVVVAVRAKRPVIPFGLPQSVRAMDPSQPLGSTLGFTQIDPMTNFPLFVANAIANYDNEYVWHCHILGHEENDFMRAFIFHPNVVLPDAPKSLMAATAGTIKWTDMTPALGVDAAGVATLGNPKNEIGFKVLRSSNGTAFVEAGRTRANATSWNDTRRVINMPYSYKVVAYNAMGDSLPSNAINVKWSAATPPPAAPSGVAPVGVAAVAGAARSISVNWTDNSTNESGFTVQRCLMNTALTACGAWGTVGTVGANITTFPNSAGLTTGRSYRYQVRANGAAGSSLYAGPSNPVMAP